MMIGKFKEPKEQKKLMIQKTLNRYNSNNINYPKTLSNNFIETKLEENFINKNPPVKPGSNAEKYILLLKAYTPSNCIIKQLTVQSNTSMEHSILCTKTVKLSCCYCYEDTETNFDEYDRIIFH